MHPSVIVSRSSRHLLLSLAAASTVAACVPMPGAWGSASTVAPAATVTPPSAAPQPGGPVAAGPSGGGGGPGSRAAPPSAPDSNFGTVTLPVGFEPDPLTAQGVVGAARPVRSLGRVPATCRGRIARQPDYVLQLDGAFDYLSVKAESAADATLVVRGPGGVSCDDDGGGGTTPRVHGAWPAGRYEVWVGATRAPRRPTPFTLVVSRARETGGAVLPVSPVASAPSPMIAGNASQPTYPIGGSPARAVAASPSLRPRPGSRVDDSASNFGTIRVQSGFEPDPVVVRGRSGGGYSAQSFGGASCMGFIDDTPDHVLALESGFSYLRVETASPSDTTLVIRGPDGSIFCDDDSAGNRGARIAGEWGAGNYDVWVGSYRQNETASYSLTVTEYAPPETQTNGGVDATAAAPRATPSAECPTVRTMRWLSVYADADESVLGPVRASESLACEQGLSIAENDSWPNGQHARWNGSFYYPNGQYAYWNDSWYYPNGQYAYWNGSWYYANGQYAQWSDTYYAPDGAQVGSEDALIRWACERATAEECRSGVARVRAESGFDRMLELLYLVYVAAH